MIIGDFLPPRPRGLARAAPNPAELVVDLSDLDGDCGPALVRVLGQLRVHRLTAGTRVEVHGAPPALTAEIGTRPATAYTVHDGPSDG